MDPTLRKSPFPAPRLSHPFERTTRSPSLTQVAADVWRLATLNANAMVIASGDGGWVLVDAGIPYMPRRFFAASEYLFGGRPPKAVVLTHGHFDHTGNLKRLLRRWEVPVYAHSAEFPYLNGRSDYPPSDPTVGGLEAQLSRLYPRRGVNLGRHLHALPEDGSIPGLAGWRWVFTPGHTVGHISLFREEGRVLVAGDAIITVDQETARGFFLRPPVIHGPPIYFTTHWNAAVKSVGRLADLEPRVLVTGHGQAIVSDDLAGELRAFADAFGPPAHGRYVEAEPIQDEQRGVLALPPAPPDPMKWVLAGTAVAGVGLGLMLLARSRRQA